MATIATLSVRVQAEGVEQAAASFKKIEAVSAGAERRLAGLASAVAKVGAVAAGVAVAGTVALAYALKRAADAAAEGDAAMALLEAAMRRTGVKGAAESAEAFGRFASQLQLTSRFTDEEIVKAGALATALGVQRSSLEKATQAAADMATQTGGDLVTALRGMSLAAQGNTRILQQAGVKIDEAKLKAGGLVAVIDALNAKFGGAAAASVSTYEGRLIVLGNAWGEVAESIGRMITTSPAINAAITEVTNAVVALAGWIDTNREAAQSWIKVGMLGIVRGMGAVLIALKVGAKAFAAFKVAGNLVFAGLLKVMEVFVTAQANVVEGFASMARIVSKIPGQSGFGVIADELQKVADARGKFADTLALMGDAATETAVEGLAMFDPINDMFDRLNERLHEFFDTISNGTTVVKGLGSAAKGVLSGRGGSFIGSSGMAGGYMSASGAAAAATAARADAVGESTGRQIRYMENVEGAGGILKGGVSGIAGNVMQGAATAGPLGAFAALIAASEGFAAVLEPVNELLQMVSDTLGEALMPFVPLLNDIVEAFRPMLDAVRPLIGLFVALSPGLLVLGPALRGLAGLIGNVTDWITDAILGFLLAVKKLLKRLHISWDPLNDAIRDLKNAHTEAAEASREMTSGLIGLADGWKIALNRFNADDGRPWWAGSGSGSGGSGSGDNFGAWFVGANQGGAPDPLAMASSATSGGEFAGAVINVFGVQSRSELLREVRSAERERRNVDRGMPGSRYAMGRG